MDVGGRTYIPQFGTVESLCDVVDALTVAAEEEDFVRYVRWAFVVEEKDLVFEELPLCLRAA